MLKAIVTTVVTLCASLVLGQDHTLSPNNTSNNNSTTTYKHSTSKHKLLVIPYEPKLYMSEIDRDIISKTQLTSHQVRNRVRLGLNHIVSAEAQKAYPSISMLGTDDVEVAKDLQYIYSSIGYKYEAVPDADLQAGEQEKATGAKKLLNKFKRKEETTKAPGTRVEEGQLVGEPEHRERYMNTNIVNPNLLDYLSQKYEADVFLFINQLDLEGAAEPGQQGLSDSDFRRRIKVHYTIFDHTGKQLYGGTAITLFPPNTNDLNGIIKGYFPVVAQSITARLMPGASLEQQEHEKKAKQQRKEIEEY